MYRKAKIFIFIALICVKSISGENKFKDGLAAAEKVADVAIDQIYKNWQIDKFPNFLKSCFMTKHSWDFLKLKFRQKILIAESTKATQNFTICFAGSSVTAGHDSPFDKSFSVLTGTGMAPILKELNVNVNIRSAALGNNPCYPYDICIKTFCGIDADIVHWEQSYFCDFNRDHISTLEQFIRQSMTMESRPIIIFADSATPNWHEKDCPNPIVPHTVTTEEKDMLRASAQTIATEINKDQHWIPSELAKAYKGASMQSWKHFHYNNEYKCQGPYHKDWGVDHHSYFWLSAWRDSIADILRSSSKESSSTENMMHDTTRHIESIIKAHPMPIQPVHKSNISDNIRCYTDYEPRTMRENSLTSLVISGLMRHEGDTSGSSGVNSVSSSGNNTGE
eukprot:gene9611-19976_t